nr:10101_t:CDS:2 [Entrophospora candida]CAG8504082.1 14727_t:CDS:2 [Entrophospora candida]
MQEKNYSKLPETIQEPFTEHIENEEVKVEETYQPSNFSVQFSNVTNVTKVGLDFASVVSKVTFDTMKLTTQTGLGITKVVTGTVSDSLISINKATMNAINNNNGDIDNNGNNDNTGYSFIPMIIDTSTNILHKTLSIAENIALFGIDLTSDTIQYSLDTTTDGLSVVESLFGISDSAKALEEFVTLVKREWRFDDIDENSCDDTIHNSDRSVNNIDGGDISNNLDTTNDGNNNNVTKFRTLRIMKALIVWTFIQHITRKRWMNKINGSCEKIKHVDLCNIDKDWRKLNLYEKLYEIMVGEIATPDNGMLDQENEDLNNLFIETAKKYNNPYLEEKSSQTIDEKLFTLAHNLKRYSKFSSSAYDFKNTLLSKLPFNRNKRDHGNWYKFSFASQTKLPLNSIIDSSHHNIHYNKNDDGGYHPTYFIIRDRTTSSIILAFRGTMSVNDLIIDLTCDYEDFQLPHDNKTYKVHKGIYKVAKKLATPKKSKVFETIKKELRNNEGYGLVLVGHSLGIASILALLFASPKTCKTTKSSGLPVGRRVHAYAFASPCVMSGDLSKLAIPLVTSVAYRTDVITRLSVGHIKDLRDMIKFLCKKNNNIDGDNEEFVSVIIKKILKYQSSRFTSNSSKEECEDFFWETSQKIYEHMNNTKLYPGGQVFWIIDNNNNVDSGGDNECRREENINVNQLLKVNDVEKAFNEIRFSPNMIIDHLPNVYELVIMKL